MILSSFRRLVAVVVRKPALVSRDPRSLSTWIRIFRWLASTACSNKEGAFSRRLILLRRISSMLSATGQIINKTSPNSCFVRFDLSLLCFCQGNKLLDLDLQILVKEGVLGADKFLHQGKR